MTFDEKHPKFVLDKNMTKTMYSRSTGSYVTLYQIVYRNGELGGFIDDEECLSQEGPCKIYEGSCVFENSRISDSAQIFNSIICNEVDIRGKAVIKNSEIYRSVDIKDTEVTESEICSGTSDAHLQIYWDGTITNVRLFAD